MGSPARASDGRRFSRSKLGNLWSGSWVAWAWTTLYPYTGSAQGLLKAKLRPRASAGQPREALLPPSRSDLPRCLPTYGAWFPFSHSRSRAEREAYPLVAEKYRAMGGLGGRAPAVCAPGNLGEPPQAVEEDCTPWQAWLPGSLAAGGCHRQTAAPSKLGSSPCPQAGPTATLLTLTLAYV